MDMGGPANTLFGPIRQQKLKQLLHCIRPRGPVWYVCLKTKNCCLKTFIEIRVGEKVC